MATKHFDDNWTAYWAAAKMLFKNEPEITESTRQIRSIKYTGHISNYLEQLTDLNSRVEYTGQSIRDQITDEMHSEIVDLMYTIELLPMEDEEFLQVLKRAGKRIEHKEQTHVKAKSPFHKSYSDEISKQLFKENKEKIDKKKKKNSINSENNRMEKKAQKKTRDFKFRSIKEALKGIMEELIAKDTEAKAYSSRCGRDGHYMQECYAKKTEEGVDIMKSTVLVTRKEREILTKSYR
jgi:hypothetical protein